MTPPTTDEIIAAVDQLERWGGRVRVTVTLDRDTIGAGPGVAGLLRCLRAIVDAAPEYARRRATAADVAAEDERNARDYARRLARGGVVPTQETDR